MDIISTFLSIVALITAGLSLFIVRGEYRDSNKVFSLFILSISLWAFGLLMFRVSSSLTTALNYTRFFYVMAAAIPAFFLHFSYLFPIKIKIPRWKSVLIYVPLFIVTLGLIINENFILDKIYLADDSVKLVIVNLFNYVIYTAYFVSYLIFSYINLLKSFFRSTDQTERIQLRFIFIGTFVPYLCAMYFDLFLPIVNYRYVWAGPFFSFVVVWVLLYAVYKHHLLNARAIAAELMIVTLWIFILFRALLAESNNELIINLILLLSTIIGGIFLIRSVNKQIAQRERIQLLATDLQSANDAQVNLIHIMNHQIKGRFSDARSAFAMLLEGEYGTIPDAAKTILKQGLEQTEVGVDYVQGILKGLSATNGTLPYEMKELDLKALVKRVADKLAPKAAEKKLKYEVNLANGDYMITGDETQLGEAIGNLINNSIAYTPTGSIHVWLTKKGNKALFAVQDTGVGITEEDKSKLFKSGGRGKDSIKTNVDSTGYGLSFVKGVIEAHHGRVWTESDGPGKGSAFYVELLMGAGVK